jgi:hydroxyacyl-ACP dehydratase HTD2-like protein with hotdog domain
MGVRQTSVCRDFISNNNKLMKALIKYREAVTDLQPRVAAAGYPGYPISSTRLNPDGVVSYYTTLPNVAAERQRWAGGRYRFAV